MSYTVQYFSVAAHDLNSMTIYKVKLMQNWVKCFTRFCVRAGKFSRLEHVLIVGTAGAVPHYTDYGRHVRLGDIVVSVPRSSEEPLYIHCQVSIHSGLRLSTRAVLAV